MSVSVVVFYYVNSYERLTESPALGSNYGGTASEDYVLKGGNTLFKSASGGDMPYRSRFDII